MAGQPAQHRTRPGFVQGRRRRRDGDVSQDWTTDPGNSSHPPATVDPVIPVIVSSQITKDGPVISGDVTEVALVQVAPGYAGDPGHPGTGTVIGFACGGPGGGILNS